MIDLGHWQTQLLLENDVIPFGFVYKITCIPLKKMYIGKKQCISSIKLKPLKGKKQKRHITKDSNWREYTSSSRELNEDIIKYGKDQFSFEIIKWCESKFDLSYSEIKIQIENEVLFRNDYYNGIINVRLSKPKVKDVNRLQDSTV